MPKWVTFSGDGYKPMGTGAWRYLNPAYLTKDENDKKPYDYYIVMYVGTPHSVSDRTIDC